MEEATTLLDQASALVNAGQTPQAAALIAPLDGLLPEGSVQYLRHRAFMGLAAMTGGRHYEGIRLLIPVVDKLEDSAYASEAIRALSRLAFGLAMMGDPEDGLPWAMRAVQLAERLGDKQALMSALSNLGGIHYERQDYGSAAAAYDRAVEQGRRLGSPTLVMILLNQANNLLEGAGSENCPLNPDEKAERGRRAKAVLDELAPTAAAHKNSFVRGYALSLMAEAELVMGNLDQAEVQAARALEEDAGEGRPLAEAALTRGRVERQRGRYDRAIHWFECALEYSKEQHDSHMAALSAMEDLYVRTDNPVEAGQWARRRADYLEAYYRKRLASMAEVTRLVADTQRVRLRAAALEEENRTLALLGELGKELAGARQIDVIVASLRNHLAALIKPSAFGIFMLEGEALKPLAVWEHDSPISMEALPLDSPSFFIARSARERRDLFFDSARNPAQAITVLPGTDYMESLLYSPIMVGDRLIGVMTVQAQGTDYFGPRERSIFSSLCSYSAIALDNALAYGELARANQRIKENIKQLALAERMASLGRLTAGIAHEMNTPLAAMRASIATAKKLAAEYRDSIDDPEVNADDHGHIAGELLAALDLADRAGDRAAAFVRNIKGKTRDDRPEDELVFDPEEAFRNALPLLEHRLGAKGARLELEGTGAGFAIKGSPQRFSQVVANLVDNAVDAIPERDGLVVVSFRASNGKLVLTVTDNGCGMDRETAERAFEPMFTTKPFGQGSGLGLSIARDIVSGGFRGSIRCQSAPDEGTVMTVEIPLAEAT